MYAVTILEKDKFVIPESIYACSHVLYTLEASSREEFSEKFSLVFQIFANLRRPCALHVTLPGVDEILAFHNGEGRY